MSYADFFQPTPTPAPKPVEPVGFDLIRDMLMRKIFDLQANPYGGTPQFSNKLNMNVPAFMGWPQSPTSGGTGPGPQTGLQYQTDPGGYFGGGLRSGQRVPISFGNHAMTDAKPVTPKPPTSMPVSNPIAMHLIMNMLSRFGQPQRHFDMQPYGLGNYGNYSIFSPGGTSQSRSPQTGPGPSPGYGVTYGPRAMSLNDLQGMFSRAGAPLSGVEGGSPTFGGASSAHLLGFERALQRAGINSGTSDKLSRQAAIYGAQQQANLTPQQRAAQNAADTAQNTKRSAAGLNQGVTLPTAAELDMTPAQYADFAKENRYAEQQAAGAAGDRKKLLQIQAEVANARRARGYK